MFDFLKGEMDKAMDIYWKLWRHSDERVEPWEFATILVHYTTDGRKILAMV